MKTNTRLKTELDDLCGRLRISHDELTEEEVREVKRCCSRMDEINREVDNMLMYAPARIVSGVPFYVLTACAEKWLNKAADWWPESPVMRFWARVYASMHAHDKRAFKKLDTQLAASFRLLLTSLRFMFARDKVERAVMTAVYAKRGRACTERLTRWECRIWSGFVSRNMEKTGIHGGEWLWGRSAGVTIRDYLYLHARVPRVEIVFALRSCRRWEMLREFEMRLQELSVAKKAIKDRIEKERAA